VSNDPFYIQQIEREFNRHGSTGKSVGLALVVVPSFMMAVHRAGELRARYPGAVFSEARSELKLPSGYRVLFAFPCGDRHCHRGRHYSALEQEVFLDDFEWIHTRLRSQDPVLQKEINEHYAATYGNRGLGPGAKRAFLRSP
jgi:hypothetical protein